jgi:hypothetical protein
MAPFTKSPASLLDPDCENGLLWRSIFGLQRTSAISFAESSREKQKALDFHNQAAEVSARSRRPF